MRQIASLAPTIEEIYFAGGEPLVTEEHYEVLDLLLARGRSDVRLKYNTNLSRLDFRGRDVIEVWNRFARVDVSASLDGSHARGELQRKEQVWEKTAAAAASIRKRSPHVSLRVTPTVSVFNLLHVPAFHREWAEAGIVRPLDFWPSVLSEPAIYDIRVLPESLKFRARTLYRDHEAWLLSLSHEDTELLRRNVSFWRAVITRLDSADRSALSPQFVARTKALDRLRGEDTEAVFPELGDLFEAGRR